jgi:Smg protein
MMKETVFDVLMYLFENYMHEGPEFHPDQKQLAVELVEAGFHRGEIRKAFRWLEGLSAQRNDTVTTIFRSESSAVRHYVAAEIRKLDSECRGFLLSMERNGALDGHMRELVIDRAMALDLEEISLDQLKWIVLMVVGNQPGHEQAHALLEDLVFDVISDQVH